MAKEKYYILCYYPDLIELQNAPLTYSLCVAYRLTLFKNGIFAI